jgi:hypothetical protein
MFRHSETRDLVANICLDTQESIPTKERMGCDVVPMRPCVLKKAPWSGTSCGRLRAVPKPTLASDPPMLGPAKSRRLDDPITVSLEALVPEDNFYWHLEATLDLDFVRDWTRELYAERAAPPSTP